VQRRTDASGLIAFSAEMTAVISIRLFVVAAAEPPSSLTWPWERSTAAQPPGPGLPEQAPSVKTVTGFIPA